MEEAASQPETPPPQKFVLWPLFFCVLPVVIAFGLFWLINRPSASNTAENKSSSSADLGPRGMPLTPRANSDAPEDNRESTPPANTGETTPKPDQAPEAFPSEREIEIHIKNLKFAVQRNNAKGAELESQWLRKARPPKLVDEKLILALEAESDAFVRLAFFECLNSADTKLAWVLSVYRAKTGKFLGTDESFAAGEPQEFRAYAALLTRIDPWLPEAKAFVENALTVEKPDWAVEVSLWALMDRVYRSESEERRAEISWAGPALEQLLRRATLKTELLTLAFWDWAARFATQTEFLAALSDVALARYIPDILVAYGPRPAPGALFIRGDIKMSDCVKRLIEPHEPIFNLIRQLLNGATDAAIKRRMIEAIAAADVDRLADYTGLVEAGIALRDASLSDYLAALGRMARTDKDLKRVAEYANDPNADVARGAINGLRQSPLKAADDELRTILSVGQNSGVKGDALAALLERNPQTRDALVDDYLGEDKAVGLRVIAVSYLSTKRLDKLKELGENDPELRVREAAINKLGSLKDKSLKTWFTRVSRSDPVPVLRQLAKKYAAELE